MLTYNMVLAAAAQAGDSLAAEQWFNKMTKEPLLGPGSSGPYKWRYTLVIWGYGTPYTCARYLLENRLKLDLRTHLSFFFFYF